ncbi:MBL fold metallo-hydrolase [Aliiroseovarius subalbicans]|uniref:MBL fold metallo-hydrolase n=1 Tax=Aliiroseovarius subalbicans TaxID=2925840 RepID=UPI001F5994C7|nr:MBL fold metallo-hydrolase [Aliiroseovarius subalbicans]MCI2399428.1 MBL fold metallo-hydrolase [Aliiroseovarius subalbicans]
MRLILTALLILAPVQALAQTLRVEPVAENVFAIVGPLTQRDPENLGNNATFGLVVTDAGAVLIDAGAGWQAAEALHDTIRSVTEQPVTHVINSGGQDHRWLGNAYWQAQGAQVLASEDAVADHKDRQSMQLTGLRQLVGDGLDGTEPGYADVTFGDAHDLSLGGVEMQIRHPGAAHTPGDSFIWLPAQSVVFTGDMVYVERMLGVGSMSNAGEWVTGFEAIAALAPTHVVPGHGAPTDLATATRDTYDVLVNLRHQIGALIDDGGDIIDAPKVDQSAFSYLENFEGLAGRNAQEVFSQMEWE